MAIQKKGAQLSGKVGDKVYAVQSGRTLVREQSKKAHKLSEANVKSGKDLVEASTQ